MTAARDSPTLRLPQTSVRVVEMTEDDLGVLAAREEATRWMGIAIAAALVKLDPKAYDTLLTVLEAASLHLSATGSPHAAGFLDSSVAMLKGLTQEGNLDPAKAMVMNAVLHLQTAPDQHEALRTWLEVATADELSDQVRELLEGLSGSPPEGDA